MKTLPSLSDAPRPLWAQVNLLHLTVIALSLLMTLGAWQFSKNQVETRTAARFAEARDQTVDLIRDRMANYEDALWSGVSAIESHGGSMTRAQWRDFASAQRIEERYPGINGIGVIHVLSRDDAGPYMADRLDERPGFAVFPQHDAPLLMPISFIEPEDINAAAVGLDVAHETNRRTGALASVTTGLARITGPITLVQDEGATPGFLFYAPYYNGTPATADARRAQIAGLVYAPFVVRKLVAGLLARDRRNVQFSIRDAGTVIYDEHGQGGADDPAPMFSETVQLNLYGRDWVLDIRSDLGFRAANTFVEPWFVLAGGLLIEALIIALLVLMSRANHRAIAYAEQVTQALRCEKQKLARTNEELEQFAYAASHDLQTPIRGIGSLTLMLREDMADFLASGAAHAEISEHLDGIEDRVGRMGDLTQGIMAFSRVNAADTPAAPLDLAQAIEEMRADFGLDRDALTLGGDVVAVSTDGFNLRRVLENLVSNAIKYHDGLAPLRITVSGHCQGDRLRFEVADNGPGIDPQYHERIFRVFQTLRLPGEEESTGIGLSIVQKIVEAQGGAVTLNSAPGKGACFAFDWPRDISDMARPRAA